MFLMAVLMVFVACFTLAAVAMLVTSMVLQGNSTRAPPCNWPLKPRTGREF